MRCRPAVALFTLALSVHAVAQHGGGAHGGFSGGHSGFGASHSSFGGFRPSARPGSAGPSRYMGQAQRFSSPQHFAYGRGYAPLSGAPVGTRPTFFTRYRNPYRYPAYGYANLLDSAFPYSFSNAGFDTGWNDPNTLGYDGVSFQGDPGLPYPAAQPDDGYSAKGMPSPTPPLRGSVGNASLQSQPPAEEDAVTLIFKDGRPSEQIHNYALTRTALYVTGKHIREIPIDQLDLQSTQRVNREAGVDFRLP